MKERKGGEMRTIWKVALNEEQIELPEGSELLTVQVQDGQPMVWALVETDNARETISLTVVGTGHALPAQAGRYVGTFQFPEERVVFHVFE